MKTNILKVILMTIAICTAASNTAIAQDRHHNGHNSARIENHNNGGRNHHNPAPQMGNHGGKAHHNGGMHGHAMAPQHHSSSAIHHGGPIRGHHSGMAFRGGHRPYYHMHRYTRVRYPHALPAYVHYRSYSVLPAIGAILTDLPLNAVEVLINGNYYYSALGLLFRPFYIDGIMHFEVMRPF